MRRRAILALAVCLAAACGGGTPAPPTPSPTAPSLPAPTPSPANQPPQIVSATIDPSVGVKDLTTFTARAEVIDPDADPVTISWSAPGRGVVATGSTLSFRGGEFSGPLTVTATDSRGATATASIPFSAPDLGAFFDGYFGGRRDVLFSMRLSRTGELLSGTFTIIGPGNQWRYGSLDPAEPCRITADGAFHIRVKAGSDDFILQGRLEAYPEGGITAEFLSNYVGKGRVIGGPYAGQAFIFGEHNPY
jgi:hypothetical protein